MKKTIPILAAKPQIEVATTDHVMTLIVKISEKCNFKCTFCSSSNLSDDDTAMLDIENIKTFLKRYPKTHSVIVNGGDPLMVPIRYYWELIEFLEKENLPARISFTSNLWAFYKNPKKWGELFRHPRMGVGSSFNYGDTRRISEKEVFTEDHFLAISDLMLKEVGYRPDFISVISEENYDTAIASVELAKRLGVECKLNPAVASGRQRTPMTLAKLYACYVKIVELGLWEWEHNTKFMMQRLYGGEQMCPQSRSCQKSMRLIQPDGDYYACGAFGDDKAYPINFAAEMSSVKLIDPYVGASHLNYLHAGCPTCELFDICNGCRKNISDMKEAGLVEEHCALMTQLKPKIIEINEEHRRTELDFHVRIADR